jgi:hypothetical protein
MGRNKRSNENHLPGMPNKSISLKDWLKANSINESTTGAKRYIVSTNLTVKAGETVDLSSTTFDDVYMIELSWSGATGTMVLNLPLAASNANRVIRFISNTGFASSTHADVTPQGGDTLDGSTNKYRINKPYEGIEVWSNGTEWFIIQKKA